jgi:phosphate transport system substrate-binding protein
VATRFPASRRASEQVGIARLLAGTALAVVTILAAAGCGDGSPGTTGPLGTAGAVGEAGTQQSPLPSAPPAGPQSLSETGSTLLYPLFNNVWAPAYQSKFANVKITTGSTGSSTGIADATSGTADIGASDAYLSAANLVKDPALENIPLVISAQVVTYYLPGLKGNLKLNAAVLAGMYQGTITNWDDPAIRALNPGVSLPALTIVPVRRSDGSGDTFLFTSYLSKAGSKWAADVGFGTEVAWPAVAGEQADKGNAGMVAGCSAHPGCVAYIGISYLQQALTAGLGEAQLFNSSGNYVLPDAASISAAAESFATVTPAVGTISLVDSPVPGGYPIVNYEYAIVSTRQASSAKAATIKALLNWILTQGSSPTYLATLGFQPLPAQVATLADALIARIG